MESVTSNASLDPNFDLILDKDLIHNCWPEKLNDVNYQEGRCIALKVLNKNNFVNNTHLATKDNWTLSKSINTGVMNPSSYIGCHAGDVQSYSLFGEMLFDEVISKIHNGYDVTTSSHVTNTDLSNFTETLTSEIKNKIISSRVRVARNIFTFPLNPTGSLESRLAIADLMERVFGNLKGDLAGKFYRHTTMTEEERQRLIDEHFLFKGGDKMQAASGYHKFWPHGRGIFISEDKKFLSWVNEGDHLRLISMEDGSDIKSAFERLFRGVDEIERLIKSELQSNCAFWYTPSHGFITCCPSNLGTGMRASVHITLPSIMKDFTEADLIEMAKRRNCQIRGSSGEHSDIVDRLDISNWIRLGRSEVELLHDMMMFVGDLVDLDRMCDDSMKPETFKVLDNDIPHLNLQGLTMCSKCYNECDHLPSVFETNI